MLVPQGCFQCAEPGVLGVVRGAGHGRRPCRQVQPQDASRKRGSEILHIFRRELGLADAAHAVGLHGNALCAGTDAWRKQQAVNAHEFGAAAGEFPTHHSCVVDIGQRLGSAFVAQRAFR